MLIDKNINIYHIGPNKIDYDLVLQVIDPLKDFDEACKGGGKYPLSKEGFIAWLSEDQIQEQPEEGKAY